MFLKSWFLVLLATFTTSAFSDTSIRVGVGSGMLDVISYSNGVLSGPMAPLYKCVFDYADLEVNYIELPLKRGLQYLEVDEISALLPLAKSPTRDRIGLFAGELFVTDYVFVSLDPFPVLEKKEGLKYVAPRGSVAPEFIHGQDAEIYEVTEWSQAASMLRYDRADVAVLPELLVSKLLGLDTVDVYQRSAGTLPVSLYLARNTEDTSVSSKLIAAVQDCNVQYSI
ncbi:hypothetical protein [Marinobacter orientalis]|uniref:Solute-binding protein family 3/N-terminal domain-containing protein n=1 Tax=Marinobacter orientalis TaxID=1928859 RepID=A0A7Y0RF02_9GAMM|nr:hypothetical protein [Marinobacter orientalis]NMT65012.1 hypothetical protein [Marinobacter orientalis]TGX48096.1 hypothetical protein DIT72_15865 [Marinobacter orientalis]